MLRRYKWPTITSYGKEHLYYWMLHSFFFAAADGCTLSRQQNNFDGFMWRQTRWRQHSLSSLRHLRYLPCAVGFHTLSAFTPRVFTSRVLPWPVSRSFLNSKLISRDHYRLAFSPTHQQSQVSSGTGIYFALALLAPLTFQIVIRRRPSLPSPSLFWERKNRKKKKKKI